MLKTKQKKTMSEWWKDNPNWFTQYRKKNRARVREWFDQYRKTPNGIKAIQKYERSEKRMKAKAFWNFKDRLMKKLKKGKISQYKYDKLMAEYKKTRRIK